MEITLQSGSDQQAGVKSTVGMTDMVQIARATYKFEAFDAQGVPLWDEEIHNLVTSVGKNDVLDKYFKGSSYSAAWYVGLKGPGTAAVGDTMASHAGWSEVTDYSESVRQTLTLGTVSAGSVNNSASKATYSINATVTIAGAFLVSDNTKAGATGTLYSAGDFAASRTLASGDSLQVTVTLTAS